MLDERAADGVLALTPPNVFYLTGFGQRGEAAALARRAIHPPLLVVPSGSIDFVIEGVPDRVDIIAYGRFVRAFAEEENWNPNERRIADLHRAAKVDASLISTIASELRGFRGRLLCDLDADRTAALAAALAGPEVRSDPEAFKWLRMVKGVEETRRLMAAAEVTEAGIRDVADACAVGVTQAALTRAFCTSLVQSGAELRLAHISIGRSGAFGNANVPDDRLTRGAVVKLDVGAIVQGYGSDMSRCFSLGDPSGKAGAYYGALLAGQDTALECLHPGVRACDVFQRAVETVRSSGIPHYERTNVGHGIGIAGDGYDPPLLGPSDETSLEPGMVLCVETPYYEIGFGGLQVEDMVLVTDDGFESLTTSPREMWGL